MYEHQELMDLTALGERVAEDGVHQHERALRSLATAVAPRLPGTAAVLRDTTAPTVLRERAFSVAADAIERSRVWSEEAAASVRATRGEKELQNLWLDRRGQLAGLGA
jgi:hypothetical protein